MLDEIVKRKSKFEEIERELEINTGVWTLWKFHAQHEDWFNDFIYKSGLEIPDEELRYRQVTKDVADISLRDFITYDDGIRLWKKRLELKQQIIEVKQAFLDSLIEARKQGTPISEIAEKLGMTVNGVYKIYVRNNIWDR